MLVRGSEFKASPAVVEKLTATPAVEVRYRTRWVPFGAGVVT